MEYGYWGKILRVDLTSGNISVDEHDEKFYRTYIGGRGIITHYLINEVPQGNNPLGPDNILVFAASALTGTLIPGSARNSVGAQSPLTNGYGEGEGGGNWGVKLRWAGYDGLVVTGRSEKPTYIWVTDDTVEIRDASAVWGLETYETQEMLREDVDDKKASVALIGPGGERMVRFACIALGLHNYVGRSGLGAVMGSKNLKAIVVNGTKKPMIADNEKLSALIRQVAGTAKNSPMAAMGTSILVEPQNNAGALPTHNFRDGYFEGHETLSGPHMKETITKARSGCFACPVRCKQIVEVDEASLTVSKHYGGPEYETIGSFGSNCGISDIKVVAKANEICNRNTLDTISTGMMISGAMECAEKGLLPETLVESLNLRFGSEKGLFALLNQIVDRTGLGEILSKGPKGVSDVFGLEAAACFLHVKNQPFPLHEPRFKAGMGVGYALSPTGADHIHNIHDSAYMDDQAPSFKPAQNMGILDPLGPTALGPEKARMWMYMTLNRCILNSALLCFFVPMDLDIIIDLFKAVTGWNVSNWELIKASERALTLTRVFNVRQGLTVSDDTLPAHCFRPLKNGALKGKKMDPAEFLETRDYIYQMLGWDKETSMPHPWKLYELGLGWLVKD